MNARSNFTVAEINRQTAGVKAALADIEAMGPLPMTVAVESFNDDDIYLYSVATKELLRVYPVKSPEVFCARHHGLKVLEGQAWARGRNARDLQLWRDL